MVFNERDGGKLLAELVYHNNSLQGEEEDYNNSHQFSMKNSMKKAMEELDNPLQSRVSDPHFFFCGSGSGQKL